LMRLSAAASELAQELPTELVPAYDLRLYSRGEIQAQRRSCKIPLPSGPGSKISSGRVSYLETHHGGMAENAAH
jgi:hypothetical protein